jgi:hypothetical protein
MDIQVQVNKSGLLRRVSALRGIVKHLFLMTIIAFVKRARIERSPADVVPMSCSAAPPFQPAKTAPRRAFVDSPLPER